MGTARVVRGDESVEGETNADAHVKQGRDDASVDEFKGGAVGKRRVGSGMRNSRVPELSKDMGMLPSVAQ